MINKINLHCSSTIHCQKCWKFSNYKFLTLKIEFCNQPRLLDPLLTWTVFHFLSEFELPGFYCMHVSIMFKRAESSSPTENKKTSSLCWKEVFFLNLLVQPRWYCDLLIDFYQTKDTALKRKLWKTNEKLSMPLSQDYLAALNVLR